MSIRMPRARTCGSAKTWSSVLTGPHGTPSARQSVDPLCVVLARMYGRHQRIELATVLDAQAVGREARIRGQIAGSLRTGTTSGTARRCRRPG